MMSMSEDRQDADRKITVKTVALSAVLGLVVLFSFGAVVGATTAWVESPENWGEAVLAIAGAVAVGGFATLGLLMLKPRAGRGEPISPKIRKANKLLLLSGVLGGVIGAALALSSISAGDPWAMFSNSPLPASVVFPALAVLLLIVPVISWQWHRSVDEHEAESYKFGG